jgi:hypothetical protein
MSDLMLQYKEIIESKIKELQSDFKKNHDYYLNIQSAISKLESDSKTISDTIRTFEGAIQAYSETLKLLTKVENFPSTATEQEVEMHVIEINGIRKDC